MAAKIGKDPAWVSRNMRGPRNWTFKTFGALIEALDGEVEIEAFRKEAPAQAPSNHRAYDDYSHKANETKPISRQATAAFVGKPTKIIRLIPQGV